MLGDLALLLALALVGFVALMTIAGLLSVLAEAIARLLARRLPIEPAQPQAPAQWDDWLDEVTTGNSAALLRRQLAIDDEDTVELAPPGPDDEDDEPVKRKAVKADEQDVVTGWRRVMRWRPGEVAAIKRRMRRRERHIGKHRLRRGEEP